MGSSSSRAAARGAEAAARSAAAAKQRKDAAQAALDKLPADSAVRKDARSAAQFNEWRVAQEQRLDGVTLEDENARNSALDTRMHSAMQRKEGDIEYEEHYLPLHDARLAAQLSAQAKQEGAEIQQTLNEREQSEETGGRLAHDKFVRLMAELQSQRRDKAVLRRLAKEYGVCPIDVEHIAMYCSIPEKHSTFVGSERALVAKWH